MKDVKKSIELAARISNGDINPDSKYTIENSPVLPPLEFSVSDGNHFVTVNISGITSIDELEEALGKFNPSAAFRELKDGQPPILLKEYVSKTPPTHIPLFDHLSRTPPTHHET